MSRQRIHTKLRKIVSGTKARPRLAVYRSLNEIYVQLIDDETKTTLAAASSLKSKGGLVEKAKTVGKTIAGKAKELGYQNLVFDRGGFAYKGSVKELCEAVRQEGITI